ncbi:WD40 repeat domain-containing protein [Rosistilla oblonga]|uniref:WD40 repeat domain-containing protein n=1 Tax=Rosistilla oblonga TaxID=2527990 RepID=UPI001E448835|nr:WD40 repeat domain-containing protein [Rosistilla oblonga]
MKRTPKSPVTWVALGTVAVLLVTGLAWGMIRYRAAHAFPIRAIDVSSDGTTIVSAGAADDFSEVVVWDLEEKRKVTKFAAGEGPVIWIRFLNSSGSAALMHCLLERGSSHAVTPGQMVLLDLETGREMARRSTRGYLTKTVVLPKSDRVVVLSWDSIELLQPDLRPITTLHSGSDLQLRAAAVDRDEKILAVSGKDQLHVWDLETQTALPSLVAEGTRFEKVAITPDGNWIAMTVDSNSYDQTEFPVYLWDRRNPESEVRTLMFESEVSHLAFVPGDSDRLLIVSGRDRLPSQTTLYSLAGEPLETLYSGTNAVDTIALSADGTELLLQLKRAGGSQLWDLSGDTATQLWDKRPFPLGNAIFSPNASSLIGYSDPSTVRIVDTLDTTQEFEGRGYRRPSWVWPIGSSAAGVLFLVGVNLLTKFFAGKSREQRAAVIDQVAAQLRWQRSSSISVEDLPDFEFLKQRAGGNFEFVLTGPSLDRESLMGWFKWTTRTNDSHQTHREFCFVYPDTDSTLPEFYIFPENFVSKISALAGWQDIDLDRTESLRKFSAKHVLRSNQPDRAADVVTHQFAEFLCDHPGWSIESLDGSLMLSWQNVISFQALKSRHNDPVSIVNLQKDAERIAGFLFGIR